jgi:hypothetical protein
LCTQFARLLETVPMKTNDQEDSIHSILQIVELLGNLEADLRKEVQELNTEFLTLSAEASPNEIRKKWIGKLEKLVAGKNLLEYYRWELGFDLFFQLRQIEKDMGVTITDPAMFMAESIFKEDAEIFFYIHRN